MYLTFKRKCSKKHAEPKHSEKIEVGLFLQNLDKNWLLYSGSRFEFLEKEKYILEQFNDLGLKYLEDKFSPTIRENIFLSRLKNSISPPVWKNNNCNL